MLRKQRKLQPWRRFGYVILIIIKSGELLLWFSPRIINGLRSYIKHSKGCFIRYPNTLKLVKKKLGCASFSQPLLGVWSVFPRLPRPATLCTWSFSTLLVIEGNKTFSTWTLLSMRFEVGGYLCKAPAGECNCIQFPSR